MFLQIAHKVFGGEVIFSSAQKCGNVLMFCLGVGGHLLMSCMAL